MKRTVYYSKKFPSISHPIYCECRNSEGQVYYYDAFTSYKDMESFLHMLFKNDILQFISMDKKKK